jgi:hypothetical protein
MESFLGTFHRQNGTDLWFDACPGNHRRVGLARRDFSLGQVGKQELHGAFELGDQVMIFIVRPDLARVRPSSDFCLNLPRCSAKLWR